MIAALFVLLAVLATLQRSHSVSPSQPIPILLVDSSRHSTVGRGAGLFWGRLMARIGFISSAEPSFVTNVVVRQEVTGRWERPG